MYQKKTSSWIKHLDFTLLDCLFIELAFIVAYFIRHGWTNLYNFNLYRETAGVLLLIQLFIVYFRESYKGIIRRGYFEEFKAVAIHVTIVAIMLNMYLYLTKKSEEYSRMTYVLIWVISIVFLYLVRIFWKNYIRKKSRTDKSKHALLLVTFRDKAADTLRIIKENSFGDYQIMGVVLMDEESPAGYIDNVPIVGSEENAVDFIRFHWIDEVLFDMPHGIEKYEKLINDCEIMGITVHQKLAIDSELYRHNQVVERVAGFTVLTSSISLVSNSQLFCKRAMDIVGGICGLVITGVLFFFVAPCIYFKSPGPIFFSQLRVGKNGRKFKIYKFRSMYMDAEERKKELIKENSVTSSLMFKMEDDPRVIKGVGKFIRKTSIDEFPQFFNILRGDMSLVGTRPPTVDEWSQYEIYHRKRMAIKPGLTGMWQVSGRSKITDFDQVVELDTKYIKEWSLALDLRILFKTVAVVFQKEGAS